MKEFNTRIKSKHDTTANWDNATGFIPLAGEIIIYDDYKQIPYVVEEDGELVTKILNVPGIKVGTGNGYVQDLAFVDEELRRTIMAHINNNEVHVTPEDKIFWSNKINVDDSEDILFGELSDETLILTRN